MPLTGVDLNLLLVLDALLQETSVTRAAVRVGLSQSATSHALARLRKLLDDPILVRSPRGMIPTARARQLALPLRHALSEIETALDPPRRFDPSQAARTFTVSLEDAGQVGLLPLLAARLKTEAPGVSLRVHSAVPNARDAGLADGSIDVALAVSPEPRAGFHTDEVFTTRYTTITREGHPDVGKRLGLKRFTQLGHIVLEGPGSVDPELDDVLKSRGLARRSALTVPSLLPIPWLVSRTDLVATVPDLLLALAPDLFPVERHAPPLPIEPIRGALVWHQLSHDDPAQRWLRGVLQQTCRELASPRP